MKSIEEQCRRICLAIKQHPDAIAPQEYQERSFGYPVGQDGLVRAWMLWIGTVEAGNKRRARQKLEEDGLDREALERRAYITRMIEETNPGTQKRFEYHTQNY